MDDQQLLLLPRHLLDGQAHGRDGNVQNDIDVLGVVPLPRDLRADIGFELMIGGNDFDGLAGNLAAKVGDGHLRRRDRSLARGVRSRPRQISQHADFHDVVGDLRWRGMREKEPLNDERERQCAAAALHGLSSPGASMRRSRHFMKAARPLPDRGRLRAQPTSARVRQPSSAELAHARP